MSTTFTTNDDPEYNINNGTYKFVEHMGDIAFHVVGNTLPQVYEQTLRAMFSYMCPTARADILAEREEKENRGGIATTTNSASDPHSQQAAIPNEGEGRTTIGESSSTAAHMVRGENVGDNDEGVAPSLAITSLAYTSTHGGLRTGDGADTDDASSSFAAHHTTADGKTRRTLDVTGSSLELLLFALMNESLYLFHTTQFVPCFSVKVPVIEMNGFKSHTAAIGYVEKDSDVKKFRLRCVMEGGFWYPPTRNERGVRGTEIKAITKEGLLIDVSEEDGMWHGHSIVDI